MASTTASRKAKGRRLQQRIRDDLRELGKPFGVQSGDCSSTPMGCSGVDVALSPLALKLFPFAIEAKNTESLNVSTTFWAHFEKYRGTKHLKMLIHAKNRTEPTVTMRWEDFMKLYSAWLEKRNGG